MSRKEKVGRIGLSDKRMESILKRKDRMELGFQTKQVELVKGVRRAGRDGKRQEKQLNGEARFL